MEFIRQYSNGALQPTEPADASVGFGDNVEWHITGFATIGQPVFQIRKATPKNGNVTIIRAALCAGCGQVFDSPSSAQAACCRGREIMHSECAVDLTCKWCHRPVCRECGSETSYGWTCHQHPTWK